MTLIESRLLFTALCDSHAAEVLQLFYRQAAEVFQVGHNPSSIKRPVELQYGNQRVTFVACFPLSFQCTMLVDTEDQVYQVEMELAFDSYVIT